MSDDPIYEDRLPHPPPWVVSLCDQKLAQLEEHAPEFENFTMVVTPLREPKEKDELNDTSFLRWERTCDSCGKYCPHPTEFYTGHIRRELKNGTVVFLTLGVCQQHMF